MKLLCWNVAGRVRRAAEQLERVKSTGADVVCLQEVGATASRLWCEGLAQAGFRHVRLAEPAAAPAPGRVLSVLTASHTEFDVVELEDLPLPERALATRIDGLELINVHSPISQRPGLIKVLTHEALHAHLAAGRGPRAVCGDLNTPRREHPDGSVWTFARDRYGRLRPERGERWDQAELALIKGLEPHGFRDAFRALHGHERRELSWEWPRWGGGYRLDHLVVSSEVQASAVEYLHAWREERLSDHSPLLAVLDW
ncbi:MAG TPA: endonuclease/exonuclease/phosphatase family protein [Solirubrobacteraceae bacterium]|nr:endonuclease/exonuclease/phosphatase family protein [Solirubrobacteraceae bacterium]